MARKISIGLSRFEVKQVDFAKIQPETGHSSPRLKARVAGFLYLLIFLTAPSGSADAVPDKLIVNLACDIGVAVLLYYLFAPVSKLLSLVAAVFRIMFAASMALTSLNYFGEITLSKSIHSAAAFDFGYGISLIPFGVHCLLIGILIFRSMFLPRLLGVFMMLGGLGYLIFLSPQLGSHLFFPWIVIPAVVAEGSLTLWLLIVGVNARQWMHQATTPTGGVRRVA